MRFLADENVSRLVVQRLRNSGFDLTSIAETSTGVADDDVLATAANEDRIVITEDHDFGEMVGRQRPRSGPFAIKRSCPNAGSLFERPSAARFRK
jgi:predicted nuclease of predicted toxin-antitoxin system